MTLTRGAESKWHSLVRSNLSVPVLCDSTIEFPLFPLQDSKESRSYRPDNPSLFMWNNPTKKSFMGKAREAVPKTAFCIYLSQWIPTCTLLCLWSRTHELGAAWVCECNFFSVQAKYHQKQLSPFSPPRPCPHLSGFCLNGEVEKQVMAGVLLAQTVSPTYNTITSGRFFRLETLKPCVLSGSSPSIGNKFSSSVTCTLLSLEWCGLWRLMSPQQERSITHLSLWTLLSLDYQVVNAMIVPDSGEKPIKSWRTSVLSTSWHSSFNLSFGNLYFEWVKCSGLITEGTGFGTAP